ncbi:MAG: T9SS type A sorting domain-containing protein [Bacteroidetes bacterium]|nr:T9SS type A sorting domain-containing protein [Bacteroidota bacterium]
MKLQLLILLALLLFTKLIFHKQMQAQICDDWKSQSASYVITGSTPPDPSAYTWEEKGNKIQGVHLCVLNAEVIPVYIQQNNNYINFTSRFGPSTAHLYMLQLEVNVNDNGYSQIYSGSAKQDIVWYTSSSHFPELGEYDLKVRVVFFDGSIRFRQYKVKVIPSSQNLYKDNVGNTLRKWQGNDPSGLNAIVFSEGFDAYNTNPQEMYYSVAADMVECFRNNGYDVFLLDNYFGTQDIRNNAAVFASAVRYISTLYGEELIVAGGVSMGGIISRYAMAKAEYENDPLPVHTFIAIDSPHQGAVISEPLQNFKKENEEGDEFAKHALSNAAAKQLLVYNTYDPGGSIHNSFYQDLNTMNGDGYPHLTRNIGVSFSTDEPNPNSGGWYKITYHTGPLNGIIKTFDLTAAEMQAGSWLPKDLTSMSPIIKQASYWWFQLLVPGITPLYYLAIEFERFTDPAYIPYYSALDIRNGNSLFDVCIETESTTYHDVLPADILEKIVNEVILTDVYFQHTYVMGNWDLRGRKIVAGKNVTSLITQGDVIVQPTGRLNMLASEIVSLRDGFITERGAEVNIVVDPDLYFECNTKDSPEEALSPALSGSYTAEKNDVQEVIIINKKHLGEQEVLLYPNPANSMVNIFIPENFSIPLIVEVYNMYSEKLMHEVIHSVEDASFNIAHLESGSYIVKITDGRRTHIRKLLKL